MTYRVGYRVRVVVQVEQLAQAVQNVTGQSVSLALRQARGEQKHGQVDDYGPPAFAARRCRSRL